MGQEDTPDTRQVVTRVHVDQTPAASRRRVETLFSPEEAARLMQGRYQIINLWRPIEVPAYDWPLALCDFRSVDYQNDLVPTTLKFPHRDGETFSVNYNPNHRWKYVKGMTPEEFVLIKW